MSVVLRNLTVSFRRTEEELPGIACRHLGLRGRPVRHWRILRRSLDSRHGRTPRLQYTLLLDLEPALEASLLARRRPLVERYEPRPTPVVPRVTDAADPRPVVVGAGPAGLFAAVRLAQAGCPPIVLERGPDVTERSKRWAAFLKRTAPFDPESNLLFGEGGAGAYSDGKLYTRVHDVRVQEVLDALVAVGAPGEIAYAAKPHIGSNLLPALVRNLRRKLVEDGVDFRFGVRLEDLELEPAHGAARSNEPHATPAARARLVGLHTSAGPLAATSCFLATGHSARETYRMLYRRGVAMVAKPFQMGVRVEHPQALIDRAQYGASAGHPQLPPAEYQWIAKRPDGDVFSFCMCPGGEILPATERAGFICVNGASRHQRRGLLANSGFVITLDLAGSEANPWADPFRGLELQERVESMAAGLAAHPFGAPGLRLADFLETRVSRDLPESSYPFPLTPAPFEEFLPPPVVASLRAGLQTLARRVDGFAGPEGLIVGPEARSSSPIRMLRDPHAFESTSVAGLLPIGEGAGFAGGILSAAIDGLRAAEAWIATHAPAAGRST